LIEYSEDKNNDDKDNLKKQRKGHATNPTH